MPLLAAHHLGLDHRLLIVSLGDGVSPISFLNKKDGSLFILQSLQGLAGGVWKRKENGFSHGRPADLLNLYSSQDRGGCRGALSSEFSKYCSSYSQSYNYTKLCQRRRKTKTQERDVTLGMKCQSGGNTYWSIHRLFHHCLGSLEMYLIWRKLEEKQTIKLW